MGVKEGVGCWMFAFQFNCKFCYFHIKMSLVVSMDL